MVARATSKDNTISAVMEALGKTANEKKTLGVIGSFLSNLYEELASISSIIRGENSHDGLLSRVDTLEGKVDTVIEEMKKITTPPDRKNVKEYLTKEALLTALAKYIFQPIVIGVVLWLLTTWGPAVTAHIFH